MSFDARVYFTHLPPDAAARWEALLREAGLHASVEIPAEWRAGGTWRLWDARDPAKSREPADAWELPVSPVSRESLAADGFEGEALDRLAREAHQVDFSLRLSAGTTVLVAAAALAEITGGVVWDPQVAAYDAPFDARLDAVRPPRGPAGQPTLVERGIYEAAIARGIAGVYRESEAARATGRAPPTLPHLLRAWLLLCLTAGTVLFIANLGLAWKYFQPPWKPGMLYPLAFVVASGLVPLSAAFLRAGRGRWAAAHATGAFLSAAWFGLGYGLLALALALGVLLAPASRRFLAARRPR